MSRGDVCGFHRLSHVHRGTAVHTEFEHKPLFDIGDRLIAEKLTYRFARDPNVGDVVIFNPPRTAKTEKVYNEVFIKRIVALEGDDVEVKNGELCVNGQSRGKELKLEKIKYNMPKLRVPSGDVFVMGDNNSFGFSRVRDRYRKIES